MRYVSKVINFFKDIKQPNHNSKFHQYYLGHTCDFGILEYLEIETCGLIRVTGKLNSKSTTNLSYPQVSISGSPLSLISTYRIYHPDWSESDEYFNEIVFEYLVDNYSQVASDLVISFDNTSIFHLNKKFTFLKPHYEFLLNSTQVFHRDSIYGSGPPACHVSEEFFYITKELDEPILDFGCGTGVLLKKLRDQGLEVHGIELNTPLIKESLLSEAKPFINLYSGQFPLPFKDQAFNSVISLEVIEHIPDYGMAIKELARIVKNKMIVSIPDISSIPICCHNNVVPWHILEATHVNFFTQNSLGKLLEQYFTKVSFIRIAPQNTNGSKWYVSLLAVCDK